MNELHTDATIIEMVNEQEQDSEHAVLLQRGDIRSTLTARQSLDLLDWLHSHRDTLYELAHQEQEAAMEQCPYCHNWHNKGTVEQCPLKP